MNSVLLIGDTDFTTGVATQVRGLDSLAVTIVGSAKEAGAIVSTAAPDVLIIQAGELVGGSVSKTFDIERSNTYSIVIENAFSSGLKLGLPAHHISELYMERTAFSLEAGADAYLWLPFVGYEAEGDVSAAQQRAIRRSQQADEVTNEGHLKIRTQTEPSAWRPNVLQPAQSRLIQAHIQIGLNQAQRYRDLSRINDWLSAVALVDALTQLNNRRSFDLELPRKVKAARTKQVPFSLMVIDIDCFKRINDRYGHLVGDDVLKLLAKRLLANMRFYDTPFRYGGEEFVVTLSDTDLAEGHVIAQRLRQSIAQTPFIINPALSDVDQLSLTVSIGLTELSPEDDDQGRSCLNRADQLLLKAKMTGRDRVVSQ